MTSLTSVSVSGVSTWSHPVLTEADSKTRWRSRKRGRVDRRKMVVQKFLEFVLLKEQVDPKFASVEKSVNYLFGVQLTREEEDSERCWVKVEGSEHDIRRAKVRKKSFFWND